MAFDESDCAEDHQGEECQANYQVIEVKQGMLDAALFVAGGR